MQLLVASLSPVLVRAATAALTAAVLAAPVLAAPVLTMPASMPTAPLATRGRSDGSRPPLSAGTGTAVSTAGRAPGDHRAAPSKVGVSRAGLTPALTFTWPLSPRPAVRRGFEQPMTQWSPGHRGVDLMGGVGQPVLSGATGVVAFSGVVAGRGVVTVRHSGGLRTTYEPVDQRSTAGTRVSRGSRIGVISAAPGHCAPLACLHWGAILGQVYLDPLSLLGFGRPVLLPLG